MTIDGQTLGVFKRENNNKSCNGEKTKLHKIEIVVFFKFSICGTMTCISSLITSLSRHIDVIRDEIRIRDHTS